ncbi:hypothetical protein P886_2195 [Alteromonadaceae bacterium 2753L.S.0a.02]|nr:hypothetical protein P886_2195 [Alteromonadaceae bacterium 2753L.S.0a.02]
MGKRICIIVLLGLASRSLSAEYYQSGNIINRIAGTQGIMIHMDTGQPDNCEGTPNSWLLIKQEHTANMLCSISSMGFW